MRSGKKKQNKRNRRRNVLDVKLRSDHVRALRARGLAVMFGVLFGTVFTCYVLWRTADWALDQLVYENRAFAIRHVEVSTDGVISTDHLQLWSGVRPGQNLMAIDLAGIKSNLELSPNIESVAVERVLPTTLRIRVAERRPIARVVLPRRTEQGDIVLQGWQLAPDGTVMLPIDPKYCSTDNLPSEEDLPLFTGVRPNELRLGRAVEASRVHTALAFVESFNKSGMGTRVRLTRLDLSQSGVLVVTTGRGAQVTLGPAEFERQLSRWRAIHEESLRLRKQILTLDLAVRDNIPLRWVEDDAAILGRPTG